MLVVDIDTANQIAKVLLDTKVRRSVESNRSEIARLVVSAPEGPRHDNEGAYMGEAAKVDLPNGRVASIIARMVQGLYYCERNEILSPDHKFRVLRQPGASFRDHYDRMKNPPTRMFGDVFGYAWVHVPKPLAMIWLLWFYDSVVYSASSVRGD
jgi:hypothetical protein